MLEDVGVVIYFVVIFGGVVEVDLKFVCKINVNVILDMIEVLKDCVLIICFVFVLIIVVYGKFLFNLVMDEMLLDLIMVYGV